MMTRRLLRMIALAVLAAALGPALCRGAAAEAAPSSFWIEEASLPPEGDAPELVPGALAEVDLDRGEAVFRFTAPSNSVYDVCLFPADEGDFQARAQLWHGDELLAEGEGGATAVSLRLTTGEAYALRLTGAGRVRLELARHALSRCFELPMALDAGGDAYSKAVARAGDVHWYAVDADSDLPAALAGIPDEPGLRLQALLFDGDGRLLAEGVRTVGGACLLGFVPRAGQRYRLRLRAVGAGTGLYNLRLERSATAAMPDRVTLSRQELALAGRSAHQLTAYFSPEAASGLVYWESSDPEVAVVDANGLVSGRGEGTAFVTAYSAWGEYDRCRVEVGYVPVSSLALITRRIALNVGDDAAVECEVLPANASRPDLVYEVSSGEAAMVDARGVVRGVAEGEAVVTVRTLDGGLEDALTVTVGPAPKRRRALLVGEQNYASTVATVRTGSVNSVAGLRSMLQALSYEDSRFQVTTLLDASRDRALAAVGEAFAGAEDGDLSLFYITCHGYYSDGMTFLQMYDGSTLAAAELAQALRGVKGEVLVVIDCCGSGGVIGRASGTGDILKGIDAVFGGATGPAAIDGSRFRVLASAALEQDSYRISFSREAVESDMATVFARALCEGCGWSIERSARSAMRADVDYDGAVSLNELYAYTARRVRWYLNLTGTISGEAYAQSVQVWPEGDARPLFARAAAR